MAPFDHHSRTASQIVSQGRRGRKSTSIGVPSVAFSDGDNVAPQTPEAYAGALQRVVGYALEDGDFGTMYRALHELRTLHGWQDGCLAPKEEQVGQEELDADPTATAQNLIRAALHVISTTPGAKKDEAILKAVDDLLDHIAPVKPDASSVEPAA